MATLVCESSLEARLRDERVANGCDRWDEVWDGVYVIPPFPNDEHQELQLELAIVLREVVKNTGRGTVFMGINVSDREQDWVDNFRVPDVVVFLNGTRAKNCGTHWFGGPDFAIEIVSPRDRSRDKLDFYEHRHARAASD